MFRFFYVARKNYGNIYCEVIVYEGCIVHLSGGVGIGRGYSCILAI